MSLKNYLKKIKRDLKNSKKIKDSFYFLFYFLVSFLVIYFILSKTFLYKQINLLIGFLTKIFIKIFFSLNSYLVFDSAIESTKLLVETFSYPVIITFLCTGILEFSLLVSAIIASRDQTIKKRIKGIFYSVFIVLIFNILRISFTILIIKNLDLTTADFFHGFLFRLFLIIIVIGFYYIWYNKIR